jgi:hypothetical protein
VALNAPVTWMTTNPGTSGVMFTPRSLAVKNGGEPFWIDSRLRLAWNELIVLELISQV